MLYNLLFVVQFVFFFLPLSNISLTSLHFFFTHSFKGQNNIPFIEYTSTIYLTSPHQWIFWKFPFFVVITNHATIKNIYPIYIICIYSFIE